MGSVLGLCLRVTRGPLRNANVQGTLEILIQLLGVDGGISIVKSPRQSMCSPGGGRNSSYSHRTRGLGPPRVVSLRHRKLREVDFTDSEWEAQPGPAL